MNEPVATEDSFRAIFKGQVGLVRISLIAETANPDEFAKAQSQIDLLGRLLLGMATSKDVHKLKCFAKVLNGQGVDERLGRRSTDCGCRGKEVANDREALPQPSVTL